MRIFENVYSPIIRRALEDEWNLWYDDPPGVYHPESDLYMVVREEITGELRPVACASLVTDSNAIIILQVTSHAKGQGRVLVEHIKRSEQKNILAVSINIDGARMLESCGFTIEEGNSELIEWKFSKPE